RERTGVEQESMRSGRVRPRSDDVAGGVDPGGRGRGGPGEVDGGKGTAAGDESMFVISCVEIETDDLTRVVDADHFSPAGAWEVDIAERAARVRKAVQHPGEA